MLAEALVVSGMRGVELLGQLRGVVALLRTVLGKNISELLLTGSSLIMSSIASAELSLLELDVIH